jgi:hypothetical protein
VGLYGFFFAGLDAFRTHESQAKAQSTGRTALNQVERDLRQSISPDDGLTAPVISLSPTSMEIYVDPQRQASVLKPRPQKVRYAIDSNQLIRESADPVGVTAPFSYGAYGRREILVDRLQNGAIAAFAAVTRQGAALPATPSPTQMRDVAQVTVRLIVSQKTGNSATTVEMRSDVALRNASRL